MDNPAFEFIRKHKEVSQETEYLVMKKVSGRVSPFELLSIFENGVCGEYGKFYSADVQTLVGWVEKYLRAKIKTPSGLADPLMNKNEIWDWRRETNKCYSAYLTGTEAKFFHPAVYDYLLLCGKIELDSYLKHYTGPDGHPDNEILWAEVQRKISEAKQAVLADLFSKYKKFGYTQVFYERN